MAVWDPHVQQAAEQDTTLLADLTSVATIHDGGGVLASVASTDSQDVAWTKFDAGAGKFTPALRAQPGNATHMSWPIDGLMDGKGGTVEAWYKHPTTAWNAVANATILELRGLTFRIWLQLNAGTATLTAQRYADAPVGAAGRQSVSVSGAISAGLVAGTWYPAAITYDGTSLRMWLDGVQVGAALAYTASPQFTDDARQGGVMIGGTFGASSGFWFSDVRVSATHRIPATDVALRSLDGTLSVNPASVDRALDPTMLGVLHTPRVTGFDAARVSAAVKVIRTAKMMNTTPIKAGAADATHPTLGASGLYSYDWQVVDRNLDEIARFGARPYISLGDTPSILGGTNPPFSGADLTSRLTEGAPNNKQVPTDMAAYQTIVGDFVHHIVVTRGDDVFAWSALNEPETTAFWLGTAAQFYDFHAKTAAGIRLHDPTTPIAGPETAGGTSGVWPFTTAMMDANIAAGADMDLLAYHDYSADIALFDQYVAAMNKYSADRALPTPVDVLIGEHNWSSYHLYDPPPTNGYFPGFYLHVMAFNASYITAWLCNALRSHSFYGFAFSHLNAYTGNPKDGGWAVAQMLLNDQRQLATYNAMKGMQKVLGDQRLAVDTTTLGPGVYGYAGRDSATGAIGLALASYGWANRIPRNITINLGLAGTWRKRRYLIDETHSSRWDIAEDGPAGDPYDDLALVEDTTGSVASVAMTMPRWSASYVVLEPVGGIPAPPTDLPNLQMVGGSMVKL